jgi:Domain of unknown function (DUF4279)
MASRLLPRVTIYFRFYGDDFDPDEIARRLGVSPTLQFRPGDPITADGRGRRRRSGWMVKVGGKETTKIEAMLSERFDVPAGVVEKLCSDLNLRAVVLCGVGQDAEETPQLEFPPEFVAWVAEMGAAIDVDVVL